MDKPIGFWTNTFAKLGLRLRRKPGSIKPLKHRGMRLEGLEPRQMLTTTDLAVSAFQANGEDWTVSYDVTGEAASAFDIGVYRSSDGVTADTLIQTQRVTGSADLAVGNGHTVTIDPNFTDVEQDYYLVVKLDSAGENSESSETNNQTVFAGGVFLNGSQLHVHGTDGADWLDLDNDGTLDVTMGAFSYSYSSATVTAIRARMHDGDDTITTSSTVGAPMWAFGGQGDDTIHGTSQGDKIYGGEGDDDLHGEGGADEIHGGDGDDVIFGGAGGDTIYGDAGNDTIYGDGATVGGSDGADVIHGGLGNDILFGGGGNDTLYGDGGNDALDGQTGTDLVLGGDGFDSPEILDDGETGYAETGTWADDAAGGGFAENQRLHASGSGTDKAAWTFSNLSSGDYEVHVTWDDPDDYGGASNAPYAVFDGTTSRGTFSVDQRYSPSGSTVADTAWQELGASSISVTSGTLKVELPQSNTGSIRADAVRIVQVGASTNLTPLAEAGGPYTTNEASAVTLDGTGSSDPESSTLTYAWDFDGDDVFGETTTAFGNETGATPSFTPPDGYTTHRVRLRVTDSGSLVHTDSATVFVHNVAPTLTISGDASVDEDETYSLSLSSSDPGTDTITGWEVNWGDGQTYTISGNPSNTTHTYTTAGNYTILATATDEDGTYSAAPLYLSVIGNLPPSADAGGPYTTSEATGVTLDGTGSSDPESSTLSYAWDFDGDEIFGETTTAFGDETGATPTFTAPDGYAVYQVSLRVTDDEILSHTDTATITVNNVAPTLTIGGNASVDEDATYTLTLSSSDPGADTISSWFINWGDTQTEPVSGNPASVTHVYAVPGPYTVQATATDEDGTYSANSHGVTVHNVNDAPVAANDIYLTDAIIPLVVGAASGVLANDTDPDTGDTLTAYVVTGPSEGSLTLNTDGSFTYTPNSGFTGPDTFTYEARDPQNASSQATVTLTLNLPPTADPGGPYSVDESQSLTLNGSGSYDPGAGPLTYDWDFDGDGVFGETGTVFDDEIGFVPNFLAGDGPATYTVSLRVTDSGGLSDTATVSIEVANVAPTVTAGGDASIVEGDSISRQGSFTDLCLDDTWTATVDYGEGSGPESLALTAERTFSLSNYYDSPGYYTVTVAVTDDDGGVGTATFHVDVDEYHAGLDNATAISPSSVTLGEIGDGTYGDSEFDLYGVALYAGDTLWVDIDAWTMDDGTRLSDLDGYLRIFDENGDQVWANDEGSCSNDYGFYNSNYDFDYYGWNVDHDSFVAFTAAYNGDYFIGVSGVANTNYNPRDYSSGVTGSTGEYRLELIRDLHQAPLGTEVYADNGSAQEGSPVEFTIHLCQAMGSTTVLEYRTRYGSATSECDYTPARGTITFGPSDTEKTVSIPTLGDSLWEANEHFTLEISGPSNVFVTATGTIFDDPDDQNQGYVYSDDWCYRHVTVENVAVTEGGQAKFVLQRNGWSDMWDQDVTLTYSTRDYTANASSDYAATTGSVTFYASDTASHTKEILIDTTVDWYQEGAERFFLDVTTPWGDHPVAVATIGDLPSPTVSLDGDFVTEGETALVRVWLERAQGQAVTITYATSDGSATDGISDVQTYQPGADYAAASGTVTIPAGERSVDIPIDTHSDWWRESQEFFYVEISTPWDYHSVAQVQIVDDPDNIPVAELEVWSSIPEGSSGQFAVFLHEAADVPITVQVNTQDGTAKAYGDDYSPRDYTSVDQAVTFQPGETIKYIDFEAFHDWERENSGPLDLLSEFFYVELSCPTLGIHDVRRVTIVDEALPHFTVSSAEVDEGETAYFTVTLAHALERSVTLGWGTSNPFGHFDDTGGSLVFAPGEVEKQIAVNTFDLSDYYYGDVPYRPDFGFHVRVDAPWTEYDLGPGTIHMLTSGPGTPPQSPPTLVARDDDFVLPHDSQCWEASFLNNDTYSGSGAYDCGFAFALVAEPEHGRVSIHEDGCFQYTPDPGFVGLDFFSYSLSVSDPFVVSDQATVCLRVTNTTPVAVADEYTVWHDTANNWFDVSVLANDVDSDPLDAFLVNSWPVPWFIPRPTEHGQLTFYPNGKFYYTPEPGFVGDDTFRYSVWDRTFWDIMPTVVRYPWWDAATVTIHVVDDHPVAEDDPILADSDAHLTVWHDSRDNWSSLSVLANDHQDLDEPLSYYGLDGYYAEGTDALRAILVTEPANGSVTLFSNGKYNYTPDPGFAGTDWFSYSVTDGAETSEPALVWIKVDNDIPDAHNDPFDLGTASSGGALGYSIWTHERRQPEAYYNGTNSGFYVFNDDQWGPDLIVDGIGVLNNDFDQDHLTVELVKCTCGNGLVYLTSDGSFEFHARPGFSGDTSFTYRVTDGVASVTRTVRLSVHREDDDTYNDWYLYYTEGVPSTQEVGWIDTYNWHEHPWFYWCSCSTHEDGPHYEVHDEYNPLFAVPLLASDAQTIVFGRGEDLFEYDVVADQFSYDQAVFQPLQQGDLGWSEQLVWYSPDQWYTDGTDRFILYRPSGDSIEFYDVGFPAIEIYWGDNSHSAAQISVEDMRRLYWNYYCVHMSYTHHHQRTLVADFSGGYFHEDYYALTSDHFPLTYWSEYSGPDANGSYFRDYYHWVFWGDCATQFVCDRYEYGVDETWYLVFDGDMPIIGEHTYAESGTYYISYDVSGLFSRPHYYYSFYENDVIAWVDEAYMYATGAANLTVVEGEAFSGTVATFTDQNVLDVAEDYSAWIDWGDGNAATRGRVNGSAGSFSVSGIYCYPLRGTYEITVTIRDKEGNRVTATAPFQVTNAVPVAVDDEYGLEVPLSTEHIFGMSLRSAGVLGNDQDASPELLTATLLSGPTAQTAGLNHSLALAPDGTFVYIPDPTYVGDVTFTYTASDGLATSNPATVTLHLGNVPPLVDAGPDALIDEGDVFTSLGSFVDAWAGPWMATVDYGDGTAPQPLGLTSDKEFALSHTYTQDGDYTVTVTVTDSRGVYGSDTVSVTVLGPADAPPQFTSTPVVVAYVGSTYYYESTASDPENGDLAFSLPLDQIDWPEGFWPSPSQQFRVEDRDTAIPGGYDQRGIIEWSPPAELLGKTVTIREVVTDEAGNETSRAIAILVQEEPGNHDPVFVSEPAEEHWRPITPVPSLDPVSPTSLSFNLAEDQSRTFTVSIDPSALQFDNCVGVDLIFIVDDSYSMEDGHDWIGEVVGEIDAELILRGFSDNNYGLIVYGAGEDPPVPFGVSVGDSNDDGVADAPFGTAEDLVDALSVLYRDGGFEDGYAGIEFALSQYEFRSNAMANLLLVTDENRDTLPFTPYDTLSFKGLLDELRVDQGITLDVVIGASLYADDGIDDVGNANGFSEVQGTWTVEPLAYTGTPGEPGAPALSIVADDYPDYPTGGAVDGSITIADNAAGGGQGFIVFDYAGADDFKFAGLDTSTDQWIIGSCHGDGWYYHVQDAAAVDLMPGVTYEASVQFSDGHVASLWINGLNVASYDFGVEDPVAENRAGVGALNGSATFGFFRIGSLQPGEDSGRTEFATSFGGTQAMGVTFDHQAFLPDGVGGFTLGVRGEDVGGLSGLTGAGDPMSWHDYALLAWQTFGTVWDINLLDNTSPENQPIRAAFSSAYVDRIGEKIDNYYCIYPVVEEAGIAFSYTRSSNPAEFFVTFTGDGLNHNFDLQYRAADGQVLGEMPLSVNGAYVYTLGVIDPDGDTPLTFHWTPGSNSHGATLSNGVITWNPTTTGSYDFSVTVSDGHGGNAEQNWTVVVNQEDLQSNTAPTIAETLPPDGMVRRDWSFQVEADDVDGEDTLRYYLIPNPADGSPWPEGMVIHRNTGLITWVPSLTQLGTYSFWVLVADGRGGEAVRQFTVDVGPQTPLNKRPEFTSKPTNMAVVGETYQYQLLAADDDGDPLTFQLFECPAGMTLDEFEGKWYLVWTPTAEQEGVQWVRVQVDDPRRGADEQFYPIMVVPANEPPVFVSTPTNAGTNLAFVYPLEAVDPNGDVVTFTLLKGPEGMQIGPVEVDYQVRECLFWPSPLAGIHEVAILATDGRGGEAVQEFTLSVAEDAPPQFQGQIPQYWIADTLQGCFFTVISAVEIDDLASDVVLSFNGTGTGPTLTPPGGGSYIYNHYEYVYTLTWTPETVGTFPVRFTATDSSGASCEVELVLEVVPEVSNSEPPVFTSTPVGPAVVNVDWDYPMTGADPDGGPSPTLTFEVIAAPTGWERLSNTLRWCPQAADVGTSAHFEIKLSDATGAWTIQSFDLPVVSQASSDEPVFTTVPYGPGIVGQTWTYEVHATDPHPGDGYPLEFRLVPDQHPAGMYLETLDDGANGKYARVTWVPEQPSVGVGYHIVIEASEQGGVNAVPQGFYLPVVAALPPNDPPEFATQTLGPMFRDAPFTFQLDVWDPNGHAIAAYEVVAEETTAPGFTTANIYPTGKIEWTPMFGGDFQIAIRAFDEYGADTVAVYPVKVFDNAYPKVIGGAVSPAFLGHPFTYKFTVNDPNSEDTIQVILNDEAIAAGLVIVEPGGAGEPEDLWTLSWPTPDPVNHPSVPVRIYVRDNHGAQVTIGFTLPVFDPADPNSPPIMPASGEIPVPAGRPFSFQVRAESPNGATLTYALSPYSTTTELPAGLTITSGGLIQWTPTVDQAGEGPDGTTYYVRVTVDDKDAEGAPIGSTLPSTMDLVLVVLRPEYFTPAPPQIDSTAPTGATAGQEFIYVPHLADGLFSGLEWYLDLKPEGMTIDEDTGCITWTPSQSGTIADVILRVVDATGAGDIQAFTLQVGAVNRPPAFGCTFPCTWAASQAFDFDVLASDPEGHELTYQLLTPGGEPLPNATYSDISIDQQGHIQWALPTHGQHEFVVRIGEQYCPTSYTDRTLSLTVLNNLPHIPPIIIGSPHEQYASVGYEFAYQFSGLDFDTNNTGFMWSIAEGDLGDHMSIDADGLFTWTPQPDEEGAKTVKVRLTDVPVTGDSADVYVTFTLTAIDNDAPEITSPATLSPVIGTLFVHEIKARDPEGGLLTYAFDTSGGAIPDGLMIEGGTGFVWWRIPDQLTTTSYSVPIVVTDPYGATARQTLSINVSLTDTVAPTISTRVVDGDGKIYLPGDELDVNGQYWLIVDIADNSGAIDEDIDDSSITVVDVAMLELPNDYVPVQAALPYGTTWIEFTVGADGVSGTADDGLNQGNIHFELTAKDDAGNAAATELTYYVADNSVSPPAKIVEFRDSDLAVVDVHTEIIEALDVVGIANMGSYSYELILYRADGDYYEVVKEWVDDHWVYKLQSDADYVVVASGTADSNLPRTLGTVDPTLYGSGMYRLVLAIICNCGEHHYKAVDERIIEIRNDARPGSLDLSFEDLKVDLGGIPVSLARSYSSADVGLGSDDFGPGWSLTMLDAGIQVAHFDKATNSLREPMARGTRVFVTLPDGSIQRFTFDPVQVAGGQYLPYFRPDSDVASTLDIIGLDTSILLLPVGQPEAGAYQGPYVTANTNQDFIPHLFGNSFVLRTREGVEYVYDVQTGDLLAIQNDAGQRIDISVDGLVTTITGNSTSQTITITRDSSGRITGIEDPNGLSLTYAYGDYTADGTQNVAGDNLGMITLRDNTHVVYRYTDAAFPNHLTAVYDNSQIAVLQAAFDAEGRLAQLTDASGRATDLRFDMTLGDGKSVTRVDDGEGRIVDEVRDSRGKLLHSVTVLDNSGDPADWRFLVTVYRYNLRGLLTHQSLPFVVTGATGRFTQDPPEPEVDQAAWAQVNKYDKEGRRTSSVDALGNISTWKYDAWSRVIEATDPQGNVTHNVYDSYWNLLIESYVTVSSDTAKYNHTRYKYQDGQPTAVYRISPEGQETLITSNQYDSNGLLANTTDADGQATYYAYDYNGNQTHVWRNWLDPAGIKNSVVLVTVTTYDNNDRPTGTSEYELTLGSPTATIETFAAIQTALGSAQPVATTETHYNSRGLVSYTVDRFGNESHNLYDARGNAIETRTTAADADGAAGWLITRTLYDAQGRVEFTTDSYFVLAAAYPASADVAWSGTRNVYDQFDRVVRSEQHNGVTLELAADPVNSGQQITKLPSAFDWNTGATEISHTETYYDDLGWVDYTVDQYGARTESTYDAVGRQVESRYQSIDENGQTRWVVTRTVYDVLGRPIVASDAYVEALDGSMPACYGTKTTYDEMGRAIETERIEGLQIDLADPNVPAWTATGTVWVSGTVYNALGQVAQSIGRHALDEAGRATDYEYDAQGRQIAAVGPVVLDESTDDLVRHRTETHFEDGQVAESWSNIRVVVNAQGEVLSTSYAGAQQTSYQYDANGRLIRTTFADGSFTTQTYDAHGRLWKQGLQAAAGGTPLEKEFLYDNYGRLTHVTLPEVYDPDTSQMVQPVYEYGYDAWGNQTLIRDPLGRETRFAYDEQGRQLTRTLPLGFGADGIQGTADDPAPGTFTESFEYDDYGREVLAVSFEGRVTQSLYDSFTGQLVEQRFFENLTAYDNGNGTPGEVWTFTYNALGREVEVSQQVGAATRTTTTAYDAEGRVTQIASPEGTVNYRYYNDTGLLYRMFTGTEADPVEDIHYTYDTLDRLASVEVYERNNVVIDADAGEPGNQPETTRYEYDLAGNLHRERKPNGVVSDYLYDNLNRLDVLTEFKDSNGDGKYDADDGDVLLTKFDYALQADGRRSGVVEEFWFDDDADDIPDLHQNTISWTYDNIGRLVSEVFDHYDNNFDQTEQFVYDLAGNRHTKILDQGDPVDETTTYEYDANDRLLTESLDTDGLPGAERVTTYDYDHTQETLKEVRESGILQSKTDYTYDLQGRMLTAKVTSYTSGTADRIERTTYDYDVSGIRVSALLEIDTDADGTYDSATKTEFLNDPHNQTGYSQVLVETTTDVATSQIQKRVVYTLGHERISQTATTYSGGTPQSTETLSFGQDGHGSTRALFGLSGAIATVAGTRQLFHYDAYGNALGFDPAAAATDFLYSGEQTDSTGLQYLRARYYNPATGRFNRLDPFAGNIEDPQSLHKYLYCHANPVNGIDPTGEFFGLLLGAAMEANFQSTMVNFYNAANEVAQAGLAALDNFYNVKLLEAFNYIPSPPPFATRVLSVMPIVGLMLNEGEIIRVSELVRMTSVQWGQWIMDKFGYLPPPQQAGQVGEVLATAWLKKKGYSDIIAITNASNNGVDIIAQKDGVWEAFEVKSHIRKAGASLSPLQKKGPKAYTWYVLGRIQRAKGKWSNVTPEVIKTAEKVKAYLKSGGVIRGTVVNIDYALNTAGVILKRAIWRKVT